jgi:hypothetical protein
VSGPADPLGVLCAAVFGWGVWRWYRRFGETPNPIVVIGLWSIVGPALWMFFLSLVGVGWQIWLLLLPAGLALILGLAAPATLFPRKRTSVVWVSAAAALAGGHALFLALRPASGWDFRYIWGLKAKVFAAAATHDAAWLAWPPNGWQHPGYPPLWPDLLAMGIRFGGSVEGVAAVWSAFLVIFLAAACWDNLREAPPSLRLAGTTVGGFAPLILAPIYSGYAELVVASLAAVALGSLVRVSHVQQHDPASLLSLSVAIAGLSLAKNEGMVLAFGVTLAALWFGSRKAKIVAAAALAIPVASWHLFVTLSEVPREPLSMSALHWLAAGSQMLGWLRTQLVSPTSLLLSAWVLAGLALARRRTISAAVALAIWWGGVIAAYVTSLDPTLWHLSMSFDRVIAAPLPAAISLALATAGKKPTFKDKCEGLAL